jgi:hypothetical protein
MRINCFALLAVALFVQAPALLAQETDSTRVSPETQDAQQTIVFVGEKSPFTAGILSGAIFPGVGSLYAGNTSRGITHLAVGLASFAGMQAGSDDCGLVFSGPDDNCTLLGVSLGVFVVNWIWSITSGVSDAKTFNQELRQKGLHVEPALVAIRSDGQSKIGLQVLRFGI